MLKYYNVIVNTPLYIICIILAHQEMGFKIYYKIKSLTCKNQGELNKNENSVKDARLPTYTSNLHNSIKAVKMCSFFSEVLILLSNNMKLMSY